MEQGPTITSNRGSPHTTRPRRAVSYQKIERGTLDARLSTLHKMATAFGVTLSELLEESESLEESLSELELELLLLHRRSADGQAHPPAAFAAHAAHNLPDGMEPGLEETAVFDPPNFTFASVGEMYRIRRTRSSGICRSDSAEPYGMSSRYTAIGAPPKSTRSADSLSTTTGSPVRSADSTRPGSSVRATFSAGSQGRRSSGVARVSYGSGFTKAAISATKRLAQEILEKGTCSLLKDSIQTPELAALVADHAARGVPLWSEGGGTKRHHGPAAPLVGKVIDLSVEGGHHQRGEPEPKRHEGQRARALERVFDHDEARAPDGGCGEEREIAGLITLAASSHRSEAVWSGLAQGFELGGFRRMPMPEVQRSLHVVLADGGRLGQELEPRAVDAIVVGDQDIHTLSITTPCHYTGWYRFILVMYVIRNENYQFYP